MLGVLLVDDQPFIAAAVGRLLVGDPDIVLHICHDPREAPDVAIRLRAAVVLVDLVMPHSDGVSLLGLLRAHP